MQDERLSPEEKQQAILEAQIKREYDQQRMESIGKKIVITIAIINVAFAIFNLIMGAIIGPSGVIVLFLALCWHTFVSASLVLGKTWARVLFVISFVWAAIPLLLALSIHGPSTWQAVLLAYTLAAGIILFFSKSVSEYMYSVRNR